MFDNSVKNIEVVFEITTCYKVIFRWFNLAKRNVSKQCACNVHKQLSAFHLNIDSMNSIIDANLNVICSRSARCNPIILLVTTCNNYSLITYWNCYFMHIK